MQCSRCHGSGKDEGANCRRCFGRGTYADEPETALNGAEAGKAAAQRLLSEPAMRQIMEGLHHGHDSGVKGEGRELLDEFLAAAERDGITHLKDPAGVNVGGPTEAERESATCPFDDLAGEADGVRVRAAGEYGDMEALDREVDAIRAADGVALPDGGQR